MKNYFLTFLSIVLINTVFSQEKNPKMETVVLQTSAECGDCKVRIEDALNYTKGVKFAELDLETKKVTVKFAPKKINLEQIKSVINETGYDADSSKATKEAVLKLPLCCQPGGMKN